MGGAIISESGGGIIPLQGGGIIPELGGGFLRNQHSGFGLFRLRHLKGPEIRASYDCYDPRPDLERIRKMRDASHAEGNGERTYCLFVAD